MAELNIPAGPEEITPEWLTEALRSTRTIGQARVTDVVSSPVGIEGYVGQICRLFLTFDGEQEGSPLTLMAKLPSANPEIRARLTQRYEMEIRFYTELRELVRLRTPRRYYSAMNPAARQYVLLIEDLSPARVGDNVVGCTAEEARLAVLSAAAMHARLWDSPLLKELTWVPAFSDIAAEAQSRHQQLWPVFLRKYGKRASVYLLEIGEALCEAMTAIWQELGRRPQTIIHGDFRLDNLMFGAPEGGPPFAAVDWQLLKRGPGVADVSYFMATAVSPERRRGLEVELLREYHSSLVQRRLKGYDFGQCLDDYRLTLFYWVATVISAMALVDLSSERDHALASAFLERTAAAVGDHRLKELLPV